MLTGVRFAHALYELVLQPHPRVPLDEVLDRYFGVGYTHRSEGAISTRIEFAGMVAEARTQIAQGTGTVIDEFWDGDAYAERHRIRVLFVDGTVMNREVAVFGSVGPDGRFEHLSEIGFALIEDTR